MYILGYIYHLNRSWSQGRTQGGAAARPDGEGRGLARGAGAALRRAWAAARRHQVRGSVARTLQQLPDWTLQDIGIHRGEIPEVAEGIARHAEDKAAPNRSVAAITARPHPVGCG